MVNEDKTITTKDLDWREKSVFLWWRIRHRFSFVIRPRASWAQLLLALGIRDTGAITYRHADADLIPTSIDAPVQRIKLFDLGILSLLLGFKSVTIDLRNRNFTAIGQFGTITTTPQSDIGKVLRFEGDIFAIHREISKGHPAMLPSCAGCANGKLGFGPKYTFSGYFYPMNLLPQAIAENWDKETFNRIQTQTLISNLRTAKLGVGQVAAEAALFGEVYASASKRVQTTQSAPEQFASNKVCENSWLSKKMTNEICTKTDDDAPPTQHGLQRTSTGLTSRHFNRLIDPETENNSVCVPDGFCPPPFANSL